MTIATRTSRLSKRHEDRGGWWPRLHPHVEINQSVAGPTQHDQPGALGEQARLDRWHVPGIAALTDREIEEVDHGMVGETDDGRVAMISKHYYVLKR